MTGARRHSRCCRSATVRQRDVIRLGATQWNLGNADDGSEDQEEEDTPTYIDDENYLDFNDDDGGGGEAYRPPDFTVVESEETVSGSSPLDFSGLAGQDASMTQIEGDDILGSLGRTTSSPASSSGDYDQADDNRRRRIPVNRRYDPRFFDEVDDDEEYEIDDDYSYDSDYGGDGRRWDSRRPQRQPSSPSRREGGSSKFQDKIRPGTRLFVGNIPDGVRWQDIKDHFRIAGQVVFATVSVHSRTGRSRGFGYVQFETPQEAQTALSIMPNHPIFGATLEVRPDRGPQGSRVGEQRRFGGDRRGGGRDGRFERRGRGGAKQWCCGDPDAADQALSREEQLEVLETLQRRDLARKRRDYDEADRLRRELKDTHSVRLDDRSNLWWIEVRANAAFDFDEGSSYSKPREPWRQIETPHDDAINPGFVFSLLEQRDAARTRRDYVTSDRLLDTVVQSPAAPDLTILVHDESRTWRVWQDRGGDGKRRDGGGSDPAQQALDLVTRYEPSKIGEVQRMLDKFRGREYQILKRLKQRYLRGDAGSDDD